MIKCNDTICKELSESVSHSHSLMCWNPIVHPRKPPDSSPITYTTDSEETDHFVAEAIDKIAFFDDDLLGKLGYQPSSSLTIRLNAVWVLCPDHFFAHSSLQDWLQVAVERLQCSGSSCSSGKTRSPLIKVQTGVFL